MTAIDDLRTVLKESGVYAHYDGFDDRLIKGAFLALHTIATDCLAEWNKNKNYIVRLERAVENLHGKVEKP